MKNTVLIAILALFSMTGLAMGDIGEKNTAVDARAIVKDKIKKKKASRSAVWKQHHYEILMHNDRAVRIRLVRNNDRRIRLEAFPYGWHHDYSLGKTLHKKVGDYNSWIKTYAKKEKRSRKKQQPNSANSIIINSSRAGQANTQDVKYNTGLGLGYNPSTGYVGPSSQCYNYTTDLNNSILNSSFSSQDTANSVAGQTNVSASISTSYGLFSASANASYSNNYMNSSNTGAIYFNASQTFTATNTFYSLNQFGTDSSAGDNFSSECGSNFLIGTPVGMLVTGAFNWWTTDSTTSSSISTSMKGKYGLDSISAAVSTGTSTSNAASSYDFTLTITGGAGTPTSDITTAYNNNLSNMQNCFDGVTNYSDYCNDFISGVNSGVISGVQDFNTTYSASPTPKDLSGAVVFPSGIEGVSNMGSIAYQSVDSLLSASTYNDIFSEYQDQLNNYITILNQIATLYNRSSYLYSLLYDSSSNTFLFDPYPTMMDVANNYLSSLSSIYYADKQTMISNLSTCLNAPASSVSTDCSPIINLYSNGITTAYDWYSTAGPNPNLISAANQSFAQQNTIALQYTGQYTDSFSSYPMDMVWASQLPASSAWGVAVPTDYDPSSMPALIGFVDYPYVSSGAQSSSPWAMFLPLSSAGQPITSNITNFVQEFWSFSNKSWSTWTGMTLAINGGNGCTASTFDSPCTITVSGSETTQTTTPAKCSGGTSEITLEPCSNYSNDETKCTENLCFYTPPSGSSNSIKEDIFPISGFFQ